VSSVLEKFLLWQSQKLPKHRDDPGQTGYVKTKAISVCTRKLFLYNVYKVCQFHVAYLPSRCCLHCRNFANFYAYSTLAFHPLRKALMQRAVYFMCLCITTFPVNCN